MMADPEQVMADLLAEIEAGDHAAREGQLIPEQLRWLDEAKADYRRLEARLGAEQRA